MPRPPRIHLEGALYYVTSKGMEGVPLFKTPQDYQTYLGLLQGYQEQFGFRVFAVALLPDQAQCCLELTSRTTISTIMHALNSRYTKYVAKRDDHIGHVFQERFKLTLMEKSPAVLQVVSAIHRLPQRCGVTGDYRTYQWSSYADYVSEPASSSRWVREREVQEVLGRLSILHPGLSYERYVSSISDDELMRWHAEWQQQRVVGSDSFKAIARSHSQRAVPPLPDYAVSARPEPQPAEAVSVVGPAPRPSEPRSWSSMALTTSVAMMIMSLCAAALYAKNLSTLKQTVRVLAQERSRLFGGVPAQELGDQARVELASFASPERLSGTTWEMEIRPVLGVMSGEANQDRVEFRGGRVSSRELGARGFAPSRYTMTVEKRGTAHWEAMQTDRAGAMVHWQGEWDGRAMHGTLTQQVPGEAAATYSFVGVMTSPQDTANHSTREI